MRRDFTGEKILVAERRLAPVLDADKAGSGRDISPMRTAVWYRAKLSAEVAMHFETSKDRVGAIGG